ncbi:MAG: 1,4-alpha-glucan branching protein domain-containing protein, partial [Gemmatimonadales bacterium]
VLNHGRWPHGSDWIVEAAVDTYLPLLETLSILEVQELRIPLTVGVTPVLGAQLASSTFGQELDAFLTQRLAACDEAIAEFAISGEKELTPIAEYWRGRLARLERLFARIDRDIIGELRRHQDAGRIEIMSSAATHGFLPLLARDESIRLQLAVGMVEHRRLFGRAASGCWAPECAYRPRGDWQPHPGAPAMADRPGIEEHLTDAGYRYFFTDSHLAQAGRTLGLYRGGNRPDGALEPTDDPLDLPAARSPYRAYQVSPRQGRPTIATLVRDPVASRRVWSRHQGYPGDGGYLEFHKIKFPGGLKLWRVTGSEVDLGGKLRYDPNGARARVRQHAEDYAAVLQSVAIEEGAHGGELIVAPFDTELFGHWWFEGIDFILDLYRALDRSTTPRPVTASRHLADTPPSAAVHLAAGSWGANGDFSKWLNPETEWTWLRLWPAEHRFWSVAARVIDSAAAHPVLEQAARELLLAQSSDWQFIISSATAADYATKRFNEHLDSLDQLLDLLEAPSLPDHAVTVAADLRTKSDLFPTLIPALRTALASTGPLIA